MRVAAENPEVSDAERRTFVDPDSATWRFLKLRLPKSADPRDFVEIEMLRPAAWLEQHTADVGGRVLLDLEELGAKGWAEVLEIGPCPEIVPGPGSVVTATFAHQPTSEILDVTISEGRQSTGGLTLDQSSSQDTSSPASETIGVTANHPFWSVDHQAFIPVGHLEPGTRVKTHLDQIQTIVSLHPRPGPAEKVYNLEVHGEHVYFVGEDGILVHNSCGTWTYTVKDSNGNVVYIGTGTKVRVDTALTRVAKALGVDKNTLRLLSQDMGTNAAARAAENALLKKAVDAGQKFTKIGGDYIKASGNLLNKKWGTALNRTSKGNGDWFKDFWKEYDNRVGTAWDNVLKWF
jgi:hypothetical protein